MERDPGSGISQARMNLCRIAVSTLPPATRDYFARRFRSLSQTKISGASDAALEIYRYAFFGEKPPRRYREILRPILTSLRLSEE